MSKWQRIKYQPNLPLGENGKKITACKAHRELSKTVAKEGMVLLKNNNELLPLKEGAKVALFGKGSFDYVKGGGGSGDVTVEYTINLYEGMKQLKNNVSVFEELSDFYRQYTKQQYSDGKKPGLMAEPKVPQELIMKAADFTDTAIVSICRFSGEGWDRKSIFDKERNDSENEGMNRKFGYLFEHGDFYLSNAEEKMINDVKNSFKNVIVVLNVGGIIDSEWFAHDDNIQSVLMAWQGGMEGGLAAAELMCGLGNPSGKLSDTFAKRLEDYPSSYNFHESDDYVDYTEDIYVGYRYFETIPDAYQKVNYPFGFGMSYTKFQWSIENAYQQNDEISIVVNVINTGNSSGKEVMQIYAQPPQGLLGKPNKNLVAFKKTKLLSKGESQKIVLRFAIESLSSYDDLGKVAKSSYVLEKGEYCFYAGTSVRHIKKLDYVYNVEHDTIVERFSENIAPTSLKKRMLSDGSFESLPIKVKKDNDNNIFKPLTHNETEGTAPLVRAEERYNTRWAADDKHMLIDVAEAKVSLDDFIAQLSDEELAHLLGGQMNTGVADTYGFGNIKEYGIPNVMTADGPAGLRIKPDRGVFATSWPCSTQLACTWDEQMVYAVGEAGAKEVKENNLGLWLTPAINIHRSPLCGRNFEYYSEDPYLTGKLASAMVEGIQSQKIGASIKHFALNNKETNRKDSDSRVSERAAREIYLKPFEIIVKQANPWSVMTSYNIVNGYRASENAELLNDVLRKEWKYKGLVISDWWTHGEHYKEVKAGNDLKMGCGYPERLLDALKAGEINREHLANCGKRVLELILKFD